jgi:hypothetical protein
VPCPSHHELKQNSRQQSSQGHVATTCDHRCCELNRKLKSIHPLYREQASRSPTRLTQSVASTFRAFGNSFRTRFHAIHVVSALSTLTPGKHGKHHAHLLAIDSRRSTSRTLSDHRIDGPESQRLLLRRALDREATLMLRARSSKKIRRLRGQAQQNLEKSIALLFAILGFALVEAVALARILRTQMKRAIEYSRVYRSNEQA